MYERFRQDARRAVFFADREARQAGSPYLEPEHLLLGLTHEAESKANQLFTLAAHAESFRKQLEAVAPLKASKRMDIPVSDACGRVLARTVEEADQLGSRQIGTEHLLLGLLRENKSRAPVLLAGAGIDLHSARNHVRQDAGLPVLDHEPENKQVGQFVESDKQELGAQSLPITNKKLLKPLPALLLLLALLLVLYLVVRLVNS
jgi:ATP-dependent Clp protease ATP-binding subunit ClpC